MITNFTLDEFKEEKQKMSEAVKKGKTVMYPFHWFTKTTERDIQLIKTGKC